MMNYWRCDAFDGGAALEAGEGADPAAAFFAERLTVGMGAKFAPRDDAVAAVLASIEARAAVGLTESFFGSLLYVFLFPMSHGTYLKRFMSSHWRRMVAIKSMIK